MSTARTAALACGIALLGFGGWSASSGKLDRTPPTIRVEAPTQPVRGAVGITIAVQDHSPGLASVYAQVDDAPAVRIPVDAAGHAVWSIPAQPERDGVHTITIEATDHAWAFNTARSQASYTTDHTPPSIEWALEPASPSQGEIVALYVRAAEPLTGPTVTGLEQMRPLQPVHETTVRALLGLGVKTPAGEHVLQVHAADALGNTTQCGVPIVVGATQFPRGGTIRLSTKQVAARRNTEALEKMRRDRTTAYTHMDPVAHWQGATVRPIVGRRTSAFGRYRTYSDGRKKHHLGTDLANITGTLVRSALSGIVRAAGWQHLFGNAVIVHHGQGLTSSYNHLSRVDVTVGAPVAAGDVVGAL
ncbi:MAG TPA: hypothetical protein DFR83_24120, partial [Deltaproteobacteria bacterium]|nr:hypothetical protein [Deltaproteobacteria bacterium]